MKTEQIAQSTEKTFPLIPFVSVPESANLPVIPYPEIKREEQYNSPKVFIDGEWR